MGRKVRLGIWVSVALAALLTVEIAAEDAEVDDGVDVYFRDADLEALADQDLPVYLDAEPGESKKLERSWPGAPPQIPHNVEDMLPIRRDSNECLDCHHPDNVTDPDEVPVTESHFKKAQMVEGKKGEAMRLKVGSYLKGEDLSGARYNCTMCHTPQATNVATPKSGFTRVKGE